MIPAQECLPDNFMVLVHEAWTDLTKWMIVPTTIIIPFKWKSSFKDNYNHYFNSVGEFDILFAVVDKIIFCTK
jgi:hypothetical protein